MQLEYVTALLLFHFGYECLAQPLSLENCSTEKAANKENKEKSDKTQIKAYSTVEPNKTWEELANGKSVKTFQSMKVLSPAKNLSTSLENQNNIDEQKLFDDDFLSLGQHLPELTDEEYSEINKEGATPWSFLKLIDDKKHVNAAQSDAKEMASITRIYINIPIVINSGTTSLPISLMIGGNNTPGEDISGTTDPALRYKQKVYNESPIRETNRHRSNFNKIIYGARS